MPSIWSSLKFHPRADLAKSKREEPPELGSDPRPGSDLLSHIFRKPHPFIQSAVDWVVRVVHGRIRVWEALVRELCPEPVVMETTSRDHTTRTLFIK